MVSKSAPKRETKAAIAYEQIKNKLLFGEYMPGQFLQVEEVGRELGLGRTPVHQALHSLGQEGLLEIIPRKGILVRSESMDDVRQSLEVRMLLEPYCARKCAKHASKEIVTQLEECVEKQKALGTEPAQSELMPLDREMHRIIAKNSQNEMIARILKPIHERMTRTWLMPHWVEKDYVQTIKEHSAIVSAIAKGDGPAAEKAMTGHLNSIRKRMGLRS